MKGSNLDSSSVNTNINPITKKSFGNATQALCANFDFHNNPSIIDTIHMIDSNLTELFSKPINQELLDSCHFWVFSKLKQHCSTKVSINSFVIDSEDRFLANDIYRYYYPCIKSNFLISLLYNDYSYDIPEKSKNFIDNFLCSIISKDKLVCLNNGEKIIEREMDSIYSDIASRDYINYTSKQLNLYLSNIDKYRQWALEQIDSKDKNIQNAAISFVLENCVCLFPFFQDKICILETEILKKQFAADLSVLTTIPSIFGIHAKELISSYKDFSDGSWVLKMLQLELRLSITIALSLHVLLSNGKIDINELLTNKKSRECFDTYNKKLITFCRESLKKPLEGNCMNIILTSVSIYQDSVLERNDLSHGKIRSQNRPKETGDINFRLGKFLNAKSFTKIHLQDELSLMIQKILHYYDNLQSNDIKTIEKEFDIKSILNMDNRRIISSVLKQWETIFGQAESLKKYNHRNIYEYFESETNKFNERFPFICMNAINKKFPNISLKEAISLINDYHKENYKTMFAKYVLDTFLCYKINFKHPSSQDSSTIIIEDGTEIEPKELISNARNNKKYLPTLLSLAKKNNPKAFEYLVIANYRDGKLDLDDAAQILNFTKKKFEKLLKTYNLNESLSPKD